MDSPDFRAKLYHAISNISKIHPELHMTLGIVGEGSAIFILGKNPSISLEEIVVSLQRELKDDKTPFLLLYNIFGNGIRKLIMVSTLQKKDL